MTKPFFVPCAAALLLHLFLVPSTRALIHAHDADWEIQFHRADVAVRGTVLRSESFVGDHGRLFTRYGIGVDEVFKGRLPGVIEVTLPGGALNGMAEDEGCQPRLRPGQTHVLLLQRDAQRRLVPVLGCASAPRLGRDAGRDRQLLNRSRWLALGQISPGMDVTDQPVSMTGPLRVEVIEQAASSSATNLLTDAGNIPSRFLPGDRGEPIPYLVDATHLPQGITLTQALTAVSNAFNAWQNAALVTFKFEGLTNFNAPASAIAQNDGRIRVQLHDSWGVISGSSTLGVGGRAFFTTQLSSVDWTTGGRVSGNDFHASARGYVIIKHTAAANRVLSTLEEVLCHEIGHVLGLAHPSEDPNEPPGSPARQALMYYLAKQDGLGALLRTMDRTVVLQAYPTNNSPPFTFNRMMDIVTAVPQPSGNGINEITLRGYDLQQSGLTLVRAEHPPMNGSFTLNGTVLRYTANGFFGEERLDPASTEFFDVEYIRYFDGTHYSPFAAVRVLSFMPDRFPAGGGDGIPDAWMIEHFGNADPAAGPNRGANDDWDGDGLTNLQEYRAGMVPTDADSAQFAAMLPGAVLQWQAKAYELYEIHGSTNAVHWSLVKPVVPVSNTGSVALSATNAGARLYRILKVP